MSKTKAHRRSINRPSKFIEKHWNLVKRCLLGLPSFDKLRERRPYKKDNVVYLLDDKDHTAWIWQGRIGRCKTYRVPSSVEVDGTHYTVTSIEISAFNTPKTLHHLIIPDTIEYVDGDVFSFIPNLRSVHIGKGVRALSNWHFRCCPKLRVIDLSKENPHLKIEDGLVLSADGKELWRSLFHRKELRIPEGVECVKDVACWYDDKLESITFPSSLRTIGDNSFTGLPKLKKVILPEGLEDLVVQCFMDCKNLEYVDLPSTLHRIGWKTFVDCMSLKTLIVRSFIELDSRFEDPECYPFETCRLYVPQELVETYRKDSWWGLFKHILPIQ